MGQQWIQVACMGVATVACGQVEIVARAGGGYALKQGGAPYYIQGGGGHSELGLLAAAGGNSVRTWGVEQTREVLEASRGLGLTVAAGLWIEHQRHGFDYGDAAAVAAQVARHKASIDELKDEPAILMWSIGNEVWLEADDPRVWDAIEAVAAHARAVDPGRPTMTVLPHVSQAEITHILERCPSIQVLGVNSYGGIGIVMEQARAYGWDGPIVVAEWGVDGPWEVEKTAWGAPIEPTSTQKAHQIAERYEIIRNDPACLGSYVFLWGHKQEGTSTWFNLFLADGSPKAAVDTLSELWSGQTVGAPAPALSPLTLNGKRAQESPRFRPGQRLRAKFKRLDAGDSALRLEWVCRMESTERSIGGDREQGPPRIPLENPRSKGHSYHFDAPTQPGNYRLFLYAHSSDGRKAATANIPFQVRAR